MKTPDYAQSELEAIKAYDGPVGNPGPWSEPQPPAHPAILLEREIARITAKLERHRYDLGCLTAAERQTLRNAA